MNEVKPKQALDCSFTDAERDLLAKVHLLMAQEKKKKSKSERAEIMKVIGAEHQDLMIR